MEELPKSSMNVHQVSGDAVGALRAASNLPLRPVANKGQSRKETILECVVGSTLHGTSVNDGLEDLDLMAIVVEDLKTFAGFHACDTWTSRTKPNGVRSEAGDVDYVAYGLRKYLNLALKGNPTILLALFAGDEHTREITGAGRDLRALAGCIVSKQVYMPFRGYMRQQHERLLGLRGQRNVTRPELVDRYGYDTKYAAHVIRLGLQGVELLETGRMSLPMRDGERELCLKVRTGGFSLTEVSARIIEAEKALDAAFAASTLPERPDSQAVEAWMLKTYQVYWNTGTTSAFKPGGTLFVRSENANFAAAACELSGQDGVTDNGASKSENRND